LSDKTSIIDVRAAAEAGERYNIEVQALPQKAFQERTLYYWARSCKKTDRRRTRE
jgi:predicted transposase/invertase (TIGR01784 family)